MRVLIATDAFPPNCGGSGWSTYELAKGLRSRGHELVVTQPMASERPGLGAREHDGFEVLEFRRRIPNVPFVRAYLKAERLRETFGQYIQDLIGRHHVQIVHAQHVLSAAPSVMAARSARVPVVCTVRDYWPVCYWGDLRYEDTGDKPCPECSVARMTRCVRPRAGGAWPLALPMIPYMRANLTGKRRSLSHADAVIAVSRALARALRSRAPALAGLRMEIIPNIVDIASLDEMASREPRPLDEPYAVYIGKLAANKGSALLPEVVVAAKLNLPLVIVGDGPDRAALERALQASGHRFRLTGWLSRRETLVWLRHAELLVFPSRWPEPLSRVLLEASALGVPIAAMNTGGTGGILVHEENALLAGSVGQLAEHVRRLGDHPVLRERLRTTARRLVSEKFSAPVVLDRVEALYLDLVTP